MANSVIFIGSPEKNAKSFKQTVKQLFLVSPYDVLFRIFATFIPPFTKKFQKINVDFLGPLLGLLLLVALVNYGNSFKTIGSIQYPTETIVIFYIVNPILCFMLCKIGHSSITLTEISSLIGYGLYGHILTLFLSFLCFQERSNFFFFVCLILFGGLSTVRVTLVILATIAIPAARLLICSVISTVNILFVIFVHFAYMHQTYVHKGLLK